MNHPYLEEAARLCWEARNTCQQTLYTHCLVIGGMHMEEQHIRLMTDCIEICQLTADFLARRSRMHVDVCNLCAEICDACAKACEKIGDDAMMRCAKACAACAKSCRGVEQVPHAA